MWFFDCDGVLLDSNSIKTDAFRSICRRFGETVAEDMVRHHVENGGVSRFVKFRRLFDEVLCRPESPGEMEGLLAEFAKLVRAGLSTATVDHSILTVTSTLSRLNTSIHVVTGGLEEEVRWCLSRHGLDRVFDGIHGSPSSKVEHLNRLLSSGTDTAVYVGDSVHDMEVAAMLGLSSIFVSHWTETVDWRSYVADRPEIFVVDDLAALAGALGSPPSEAPDWFLSCL